MRYLAAGPDLSFGDRGKGNFELLSYLAPRYGYQTKMIQKVQENGKVISSTLIRSLVAKGQMEEVEECLGAPYTVLGTVRHGRALGRTIDIPTVNQIPEKTKLLPPHGVYYSKVRIGDKMYCGMTNIGEKPTVSVSNSIQYLSGAKGSRLIATCSVDRSGRSLGYYTVDVLDDLGTHVAKMTATCFRRG